MRTNMTTSALRRPRVESWVTILAKTVEFHTDAPFAWGQSDCGLWADLVLAMTGWDPIADCRGYTNASSGLRKLKAAGYASVIELVEDRFEEIPASFAQRGDLIVPCGRSVDVHLATSPCGTHQYTVPALNGAIHPLSSPAVCIGRHAFSKSESGAVVFEMDRRHIRAFAV